MSRWMKSGSPTKCADCGEPFFISKKGATEATWVESKLVCDNGTCGYDLEALPAFVRRAS